MMYLNSSGTPVIPVHRAEDLDAARVLALKLMQKEQQFVILLMREQDLPSRALQHEMIKWMMYCDPRVPNDVHLDSYAVEYDKQLLQNAQDAVYHYINFATQLRERMNALSDPSLR